MAGGDLMLIQDVQSYLAVRRMMGFKLHSEGTLLQSFARHSNALGKSHICAEVAIQWAGVARTVTTRARRLGQIIRLAAFLRAEDPRHEIPAAVFGPEKGPRPVPYIFSTENLGRLVQAAFELGRRNPFRGQTYGTFFSLLACTGLRVSEAIRLRFDDVTADGLIIRCSKFRKSRLVPLHSTAQTGLERYLQKRRPFAPFDDHVFVSLRRRPLLVGDAETAFRSAAERIGLNRQPGRPRPTIHALRHTFAVRSLENCPDGRDRITKHMLGLSTYLGHSKVADTYWYLEATPELMRGIADASQTFFSGGRR